MQHFRLLLTAFGLFLLPAFAALCEEAKSGRYLQEILKISPAHDKSLRDLLRVARTLPPWVRNMATDPRYVSGASEAVQVEGVPRELFGACLAGRCPESRLRVLFSTDGKVAWVLIADRTLGELVLGNPPEAAMELLRKPGL